MYSKILVPVDGSPTSQRGLDEAVALARLTGASLHLIHVVDEQSFAVAASEGATFTGDLIELLREGGRSILTAACERVRAQGLTVDGELRDSLAGRVCDQVIEAVRQTHADLIVLGTHGRRGVRRMVLGSDAESIVRLAPVPVLLVRAPESA
ncbi:MAG: universal stress protein [Proteobacteria bacterium]|nr:universal stress protein [Pseudomonadota bacterium]